MDTKSSIREQIAKYFWEVYSEEGERVEEYYENADDILKKVKAWFKQEVEKLEVIGDEGIWSIQDRHKLIPDGGEFFLSSEMNKALQRAAQAQLQEDKDRLLEVMK